MKPVAKRRTYLIAPHFQIRFIIFSLGLMLLTALVFFVANLFFIFRFMTMGQKLGLAPDHDFFILLAEQKSMLQSISLGAVVFLVPLVLISGLLFSHRVAGALIKFQNHLSELSRSQTLSEVQFREGDFFGELAEAFNEFVRSFNSKNRK